MKTAFYPRLAGGGIRKNMRLYLPYMLTCTGMVMMYYIIMFLQYSDAVLHLPSGGTISSVLGVGGWVIALFACIFLFYTNSFLIRRRKKEFGLYNILGMGKRNIAHILLWESLIIAAVSLVCGLALGITLSKLAELGLVNIMHGSVTYTLSVNVAAIIMTAAVFGVIFVLIFLNALRQVRFSSAVSLIRSENTGEKPPRGNWFIGLLGLALLAGAYYTAVTIKDPLSALTLFFAAVAMVIIGTYLLMISGSVIFCRILQRCKGYYYKPNHFVSVSSMAYRMKRNGAGLASICILATMVLVMISSTASLYFGVEDSLRTRYPKEINLELRMVDETGLSNENIAPIREKINGIANRYGVLPQNTTDYRSVTVSGLLDGTAAETDPAKVDGADINRLSDVRNFHFIPLEDYNAMTGSHETLGEGEALLYTFRTEYNDSTISFNRGNTFSIKKHVEEFAAGKEDAMNIVASMTLIVSDISQGAEGIGADADGNRMATLRWIYNFDTGVSGEEQIKLLNEINEELKNPVDPGAYFFTAESREANKDDFYGTFGGFFYLGIILSAVFIFAAVLIIYYKQISEGYEDQSRFGIMQKVGMTKREIRGSINSQLLTVFFLPLIGAAGHLAFAFPIIRELLLLFNLNNITLYAATTVISFAVFALLYMLVYRITSNAYYRIVSGMEEK